ncbi:hypothetical protein [Streptomyces sp. NPDC058294]|uniref:hypothetical protein n=1 Tax=Streptomyces sp. NPDC058294 TaxID=3346430 RepID=UPI0036E0C469
MRAQQVFDGCGRGVRVVAQGGGLVGVFGQRDAELLYRVGDLKKWARNRPRAATGTTDPD